MTDRLRILGKTMCRTLAVILILATPAVHAQTPGTQSLDAADLLERIDQLRVMSPDTANWQRQLATSEDSPRSALDLLLLDLFGPQSGAVAVDRTQARLHRVVTAAHSTLTADSRQLLQLLAEHVDRISQLQSHAERLQAQLDAERRAHDETRQKLDALRRIDTEMGGRGQQPPASEARPNGR